MNTPLSWTKPFDIRFSEVDSMGVVWHGSYLLYLEDAREAFGQQYGLGYQRFIDEGYYAPLVDVQLHYKRPLRYGMHPQIEITWQPSEAAKIIFDYLITADGQPAATARTVQVFMDKDYRLVLGNPDFFADWKRQWSSR